MKLFAQGLMLGLDLSLPMLIAMALFGVVVAR